jgi:hypothetical protein
LLAFGKKQTQIKKYKQVWRQRKNIHIYRAYSSNKLHESYTTGKVGSLKESKKKYQGKSALS